MSRRALIRALAAVSLLGATTLGVSSSGATFTSTSTTARSTVTAAADWVAPTVAVTDPGDYISGTATVVATASDAGGSGIATLKLQFAQGASSTTYVDLCSGTTSPLSCTYDTSQTADGVYKIRAVATDKAGYTTTTDPTTVTVDNTDPTAAAISTTNAGTAGKLEAGDKLVLRYSEAMSLDSIVSGWTSGTSPSFTLQVRNRSVVGTGAGDRLDFIGANLGAVDLAATGYSSSTSSSSPLKFTSTAVATTVSGGTQVTITLGTRTSGTQGTVTSSVRPVWTPASAATDLAGNGASTATVTQPTATRGF